MTPYETIRTALTPLADIDDARAAVDFAGDAEIALLGEASHGTHEFYASRATITKRLIVEGGFRGVVVEADWPDAYRVRRARALRLLRPVREDPQAYAYAERFGLETCEDAVVDVLMGLRRQSMVAGVLERDGLFVAEQNARLVKNAEEYYRTMLRGGAQSWNLRDQHMAGTIDALRNRLGERNRPAKLAVWAHNSHLGDARAAVPRFFLPLGDNQSATH